MLKQVFLREPPSRVLLECALRQRRPLWIVNQAPAHRPRRIQVADRRQEHPSSEFQRRFHAGARAIGANVVVELRERCQDAFHQLACGGVVDRLRRYPTTAVLRSASMGTDTRLALRRLAATPLFTAFAILSLAAGVAITTAMYSIV
ncbi:MAG TPA: hypothetical protein VKD69_15925, partial [Vicinamibacterales bacterium]|nr:hypothetical protein [Vicinamibacterales bacterium]